MAQETILGWLSEAGIVRVNKTRYGFDVFGGSTKENLSSTQILRLAKELESMAMGGAQVDRLPFAALTTLIDQGEVECGPLGLTLENHNGQLWIRPEGYGDAGTMDGFGFPIGIEVYDGELRVVVWPDIMDEEPQIISMEKARESHRPADASSPAGEACKKCGSPLGEERFCSDQTCPFSDWQQVVDLDDLCAMLASEVELKWDTIKRRPGKRIVAEFHPQAWIRDNAVEVDREGEVRFDVTREVLAMGLESARGLRDSRDESDELRNAATAPEWVKNWRGPFWVEVSWSIEDYLENE